MVGTAVPTPRRLSHLDQFFISVYWFGLNFHWGALLPIVIPVEVLKFVPGADKGRALATVFAGGALVALVVMPLPGRSATAPCPRTAVAGPSSLPGRC